jgi:hypothetical protein
MRRWRVLARFLGSAELACLAYTKSRRACDSKALPLLEPWKILLADTMASLWQDVRPEQQGFGLQLATATAICVDSKAAPCKHRLGIQYTDGP